MSKMEKYIIYKKTRDIVPKLHPPPSPPLFHLLLLTERESSHYLLAAVGANKQACPRALRWWAAGYLISKASRARAPPHPFIGIFSGRSYVR